MREWRPSSEAQGKALASNAYELLFGGACGGGKTEFLLIDAMKQVTKSKYHAILMRNTFPELENSLILRSHEYYPSLGGRYNSQLHRWTFPAGSIIQFGYSENDVDIQKYKSAEFAYIGLDESTTFSEFQINYIITRNRCTDKRVDKRIRLASNPTGRSHAWHKNRFITNRKPFISYIDERTGLDYTFIPSLAKDNKVLMETDPEYVKKLERLPEKERKALLLGDWDVFEGMFFSEWNSEFHVIEPCDIPSTWRKFRCIDHGRAKPTACLWGAIDYDGRVIIYREYYAAKRDADENAKHIADLSAGEVYVFTVLDSACYSKTGTGETIAEIYERNGVIAEPSPKNRLAGWALIHEYLRGNPPKMVFFNTCGNAIRTIPELQHDNKRIEDIDTDGDDHVCDALSYGLQRLHEGKSIKPHTEFEKMIANLHGGYIPPHELNEIYNNH